MNRLRAFIRRNPRWLGLLTVIAPLFIILTLQYQSLVKLQQLSLIADKWKLKEFLWTLSREIQDSYQASANLPAGPNAEYH